MTTQHKGWITRAGYAFLALQIARNTTAETSNMAKNLTTRASRR